MLVSYLVYERVAFTAIKTASEIPSLIGLLLRLFCRLEILPPAHFVCCAATAADGKTCRAVPPIFSPACWALIGQ